jgi:hypothetical protein
VQNRSSIKPAISEDKARDIAEAALKTAFGPSFNAGLKVYSNVDIRYPKNDERSVHSNDKTLQGDEKADWAFYWSSEDLNKPVKSSEEADSKAINVYGICIDGNTGEVISFANKGYTPGQKPSNLSIEAAKKMALPVVQSFNSGASVLDTTVNDETDCISFTFKLDNGATNQVTVSRFTDKVMSWAKINPNAKR